ncbi:hypothetical protein [Falsiruegeria mediterranea]|uniref:hypothetical protein n=1 Tax=Falsiruegeria mediterranea TaxID=1280832 RepID=UPI001403316E|nr:hypothetical protein [Falsiruegeria mediterranea]
MTKYRTSGSSIAKLTNAAGRTIGWVILWDNSELSALWLGGDRKAKQIDPPLPSRTIKAAKAVTTDAITDLLETLSAKSEGEI